MSFHKILCTLIFTLFSLSGVAQDAEKSAQPEKSIVSKENLLKLLFLTSASAHASATGAPEGQWNDMHVPAFLGNSLLGALGGYYLKMGIQGDDSVQALVRQTTVMNNPTARPLVASDVDQIMGQYPKNPKQQMIVVVADETKWPNFTPPVPDKDGVIDAIVVEEKTVGGLGDVPFHSKLSEVPVVVVEDRTESIIRDLSDQHQGAVSENIRRASKGNLVYGFDVLGPETITTQAQTNLRSTLMLLQEGKIPVKQIVVKTFAVDKVTMTLGSVAVIYCGLGLANDITKGAVKKSINNYWE
ncbi:MAG: hypothetical protein WCG27_09570 [Pseudomonadota bacterium]